MTNKNSEKTVTPGEVVGAAFAALPPELVDLAKNTLYTSLDAGLNYVSENIDTVDFGRFSSMASLLVKLGIKELRAYLLGGSVAASEVDELLEEFEAGGNKQQEPEDDDSGVAK